MKVSTMEGLGSPSRLRGTARFLNQLSFQPRITPTYVESSNSDEMQSDNVLLTKRVTGYNYVAKVLVESKARTLHISGAYRNKYRTYAGADVTKCNPKPKRLKRPR